MGASVSTNVAKVATNSITKVAANIVQNSTLSQSSSQIISVRNITGNVEISGNTLRQTATINMKAVFDAMFSAEAQQKLAEQVTQEAKAITSGLNIGQLSASASILDELISATIDIANNIGQSCSGLSNQNQTITVEHVRGDVTIKNNVLDQVIDLLQDCVGSSVSNNKTLQDVSAKIAQASSATATGLSEWSLTLLAGLMVGVPVVGGVFGGIYALKYIFPLVLVVGVILIALYAYYSKNVMSFTTFSSLISETPECNGTVLSTGTAATAKQAAEVCLSDDKCVAVDSKKYTVSSSGVSTQLANPVTTYYSAVDCNSVKPDNSKLVRTPKLFTGIVDPNTTTVTASVPGDVMIDLKTSEWYQLMAVGGWQQKYRIISEKFNNLSASNALPTGVGRAGDHHIFADSTMTHLYIYKSDGTKWINYVKMQGPGLFTTVPVTSNTTSFKVKERRQWLLYSGIVAVVIGIAGTVYTYTKSEK